MKFDTPKSKKIDELRHEVSLIRHEIAMMRLDNPAHDGWLLPLEGTLTAWLMAAYASAEELKKYHDLWGKD